MSDSDVIERHDEKTSDISRGEDFYNVIFHNDDFTHFLFVVFVLQALYSYDEDMATSMAQIIHNNGRGVVGIYQYSVAEDLRNKTIEMAVQNEYPLKVTIEPSLGQ